MILQRMMRVAPALMFPREHFTTLQSATRRNVPVGTLQRLSHLKGGGHLTVVVTPRRRPRLGPDSQSPTPITWLPLEALSCQRLEGPRSRMFLREHFLVEARVFNCNSPGVDCLSVPSFLRRQMFLWEHCSQFGYVCLFSSRSYAPRCCPRCQGTLCNVPAGTLDAFCT
jgi:hypothetical protein